MCKGKCKEKTRSYDAFGVPIGVTFNGDSDYKTTLGGAATIILFIVLGGNLLLNIYGLYANKIYERHESTQNTPISFNSESWTMKTKD